MSISAAGSLDRLASKDSALVSSASPKLGDSSCCLACHISTLTLLGRSSAVAYSAFPFGLLDLAADLFLRRTGSTLGAWRYRRQSLLQISYIETLGSTTLITHRAYFRTSVVCSQAYWIHPQRSGS